MLCYAYTSHTLYTHNLSILNHPANNSLLSYVDTLYPISAVTIRRISSTTDSADRITVACSIINEAIPDCENEDWLYPNIIFSYTVKPFINFTNGDQFLLEVTCLSKLENIVLSCSCLDSFTTDIGNCASSTALQTFVSKNSSSLICNMGTPLYFLTPSSDLHVLHAISTLPFSTGYIHPDTTIEIMHRKYTTTRTLDDRVTVIPNATVEVGSIQMSISTAHSFSIHDGQFVEIQIVRAVPRPQFENIVSSPDATSLRKLVCCVQVNNCYPDSTSSGGTIIHPMTLFNTSIARPYLYHIEATIHLIPLPTLFASSLSLMQIMTPDTLASQPKLHLDNSVLIQRNDVILLRETDSNGSVLFIVESVDCATSLHDGEIAWATSDCTRLIHCGYTNQLVPDCSTTHNTLSWEDEDVQRFMQILTPLLMPSKMYMSSECNSFPCEHILIKGSSSLHLVELVSKLLSSNFFPYDCSNFYTDSISDSELIIKSLFANIAKLRPCIFYLYNLEELSSTESHKSKRIVRVILDHLDKIQTATRDDSNNYPIVIVLEHNDNLSEDLHSLFLHNFEFSVGSTFAYLKQNTKCLHLASDINMRKLSNDVKHFCLDDLNLLIEIAHLRSINRPLTGEGGNTSLQNILPVVISEDFDVALHRIEQLQERSIISVQSPNVSWSDIGGLDNVKNDIISSFTGLDININTLIKNNLLKRSGLLLYGPPGCGKTMLAKAIASEFKYSFINIKGPELLNLYVGQSEQNMRNLFDQAISNAPCVIFFDEVDSVAPQRGQISDSGGVMDRVSAQLMIELDRASATAGVFVIAATNRYDMLDTALTRSGRFDKVVYVGGVSSEEQMESVFRAVIKNFTLDSSIDIRKIVKLLLVNVQAGCDVYSICYEAMMISFRRKVNEMRANQLDDQIEKIILEQQDFIQAIETFSHLVL